MSSFDIAAPARTGPVGGVIPWEPRSLRWLRPGDGRFGDVAVEVAWLARALPPEAALAASSWLPRADLGLDGIAEGAPADLAVYDADPRANPAELLRHPRRVVRRGRVIR